MELEVKKSNLDTEYNPDSGVRCLLYEATKNLGTQASDEALFTNKLQEISPNFALSQICLLVVPTYRKQNLENVQVAHHMKVTSYSSQCLE